MKSALTTLLLASIVVGTASGDLLNAPPPAWHDGLVPIPPQRLDELEPAKAERIHATRARLDALLADPAPEARMRVATLYGRLGALYAAHRLYAGAERALRNAHLLDPDEFRWPYYAAHIALEQGEPEQALKHLNAATRLDPGYATLPLRRGDALLGLSRLEAAEDAYRAALDRPGLDAAAHYGLGQVAWLQRDWVAAVEHLSETLRLQPGASAAHYPLGQALLQTGHRDAAREQLSRRGNTRPSYPDPLLDSLRSLQIGAQYHFETGVAAVKRRDYEAAARAFAAGLDEQPDNVRARTSLARSLWLGGAHAAARRELERAVRDAAEATLPRFLLAVIDDAAGATDAARFGYEAVIAVDPGHTGAISYLASLQLRQGDYTAAVARFERAIDEGVTQMPLFLHYWQALRGSGADDQRQRRTITALAQRFPEPPVFRYELARLLATSPDPTVADPGRALAIATALHDSDAGPWHAELRALCLAANGDFDAALALQERLAETARLTGGWLQAAALERVAADYRDARLPESGALIFGTLPPPAPVDPDSVMRNYPAGQPY